MSAGTRRTRTRRCRTAWSPISMRSLPVSRWPIRFVDSARSLAGHRASRVTQLVGIAHEIDRRDLLAVAADTQGVIELTVEIEQGADAAVDHRGLDADVAVCILAGHANEETRDLVGAVERIERGRFTPAAVGHGDRIFTQQAGQPRQVAAG